MSRSISFGTICDGTIASLFNVWSLTDKDSSYFFYIGEFLLSLYWLLRI